MKRPSYQIQGVGWPEINGLSRHKATISLGGGKKSAVGGEDTKAERLLQ